MTKITTIILLVSALALAACNNPNKNRAGAGAGAGMAGAGGISAGALGDPNDPNSVAYFNQTIGNLVHFSVDQSTLSPEAQGILAGQAQWLNQHPSATAVIEGHADEQGTREYNLSLGARRAASVQSFLVSQGVPANRIRTISYGKERPLEVCSEEACYAKNRRAVTVLSVGSGV